MIATRRRAVSAGLLALSAGAAARDALAQAPAPAAPNVPDKPLFAVEVRTGPKWDAAVKPQDQPYFREHSAHLKRLRDEGHLLVGARYADKGLLVLAAASEAEVRGWIDADPSMQHQTFAYELHLFRVFYAGCVGAAKRS